MAVDGAVPFYTANADFYRVDTALTVPRLDAETWSLRLHGMVDRPVALSFADLLDMPLVERDITLTCVSNEVGGPHVGNAAGPACCWARYWSRPASSRELPSC